MSGRSPAMRRASFIFSSEMTSGITASPQKLVALLAGRVVAPRGNHDFIQGVDFVRRSTSISNRPSQSADSSILPLLDGRFVHVIIFAQAAQDARAVVFVEHPCLLLPDIDVILAHGEQHRDILLGDNMALCETARPL